jgi:hypothetical protein
MIEKDEFEQFTRVYLLHNSDQSIHLFPWHFYSNSSSSGSVYTYSTQEIRVKISAIQRYRAVRERVDSSPINDKSHIHLQSDEESEQQTVLDENSSIDPSLTDECED